MSSKKVPKHPKQLIIDHYDSLVNKLDVYVEQLMEKYGDDELLEESESRAKTSDDYKKSDFKIVDDDDEDEESEDEEEIDEESSSSGEESEEGDSKHGNDKDSDSDDGLSYLERKYLKNYNFEMPKKDACENEDSDEYENEDEEEFGEDEYDKNEKEDIEIEHESEEDDDRWMDEEDLNNYSFHEYDEWDENVEDIEDEEVYEALIYGIKEFTDPYDFDYKADKHAQFELKESRSSIKTRDYLNQVRSFMIDEIRKEETQQLESYKANKARFKFDKNSSIGEMKREIFKDRFCFLIDTKNDQHHDLFKWYSQKKNREFNLCFIITDFYLSRSQLNRIKSYFDYVKELPFDYETKICLSDFILNEKNLFLQYVMQKIRYALRVNDYKFGMMFFTKSSILEQLRIDFTFKNISLVSLAKPLKIDFSSLKSLSIKHDNYLDNYNNCDVEDLSGLPNLEYLEIRKMFITKRALIGLEKLIKLVLDCCKVEKKNLDENMLISQKNRLEFLQINAVDFYLTLDSLKSLRVLSLLGVDNFKYIKSIPTENLEVLHLNTNRGSMYIDLDEIGRCFKRVNLTKVPHFRFTRTELDEAKSRWFSGLTNASRLVLCNNMIESAIFLKRVNLPNLVDLDLSMNKIKNLEQSYFQGLTNLIRLNLSSNPLKRLQPGVFSELKNLKTLFLQDIDNLEIEKDAFLGLDNLRILDFSHSKDSEFSSVKSIDEAAFDHLPGLKSLRVKNYDLKLKDVSRLKYLEEIVLYEDDLRYYNFDFKAGLNFKVILGY